MSIEQENELPPKRENPKEKKTPKPPKPELVLRWDSKSGYLIPQKWTYPYGHSKKSYIAIMFGISIKFEFDRYFCDKHEFEIEGEGDHAQRTIGVGFGKEQFKDGMILEERYSYKEAEALTTKLVYYRVFLNEDGLWGDRISKAEVKDSLQLQQQQLFQEIKALMNLFGERFVLQTMQSILKERDRLTKNVEVQFFTDLL